jgi:hypothetical protein
MLYMFNDNHIKIPKLQVNLNCNFLLNIMTSVVIDQDIYMYVVVFLERYISIKIAIVSFSLLVRTELLFPASLIRDFITYFTVPFDI